MFYFIFFAWVDHNLQAIQCQAKWRLKAIIVNLTGFSKMKFCLLKLFIAMCYYPLAHLVIVGEPQSEILRNSNLLLDKEELAANSKLWNIVVSVAKKHNVYLPNLVVKLISHLCSFFLYSLSLVYGKLKTETKVILNTKQMLYAFLIVSPHELNHSLDELHDYS